MIRQMVRWLIPRRSMGFAELLDRLRALEVPTVRRMPEPVDRARFDAFMLGEYGLALARARVGGDVHEKWGSILEAGRVVALCQEETRRLLANGISRRGKP